MPRLSPGRIHTCYSGCGCRPIGITPREEHEARQKYKTRRRRMWQIVRSHHKIANRWGMDPPPPQYHLHVVLLMEQARNEAELMHRLEASGRLGYYPDRERAKRAELLIMSLLRNRDKPQDISALKEIAEGHISPCNAENEHCSCGQREAENFTKLL